MNRSTVLVKQISIQYIVEKFLIMLYLSLEREIGLKESGYGLQPGAHPICALEWWNLDL